MNSTITFARPALLFWGLAACLAGMFFFRWSENRRHQRLARFAAPPMAAMLTANLSRQRRTAKKILLLLAVYACFTALAGPRYGVQWIEVRQRGIDILFGLDASKSMLATDMQPSRLARAKLAIRDFIDRLDGDRIGLLPFAGTTFVMCPLTTDYDAFVHSLDAVEPGLLPTPGTDLATVIHKARQVLANETNHKILILITDGEDLRGNGLKEARAAAKDGLTIHTIGVGSSQGELIPDPDHPGSFIKDDKGNVVRSRLDETSLRQIAEVTGGLYVPLGRMGEGLMRIYQEKLKLVPAELHKEQRKKIPIERYSWPLALAILLFMVEFLLSERHGNWSVTTSFLRTLTRIRTSNNLKLLIVFSTLLCHPLGANGSTAADYFHAGQLDKAEQAYSQALADKPDNPALHYNLGDVYYRQNRFAKAVQEYTRALHTDDLSLQARSYYNLGNAHFQQAKKAGSKLDRAAEAYTQAMRAYEASLKLNPEDRDARANLDLAKKELEKIRQQQKQQKNRQQKEQQQQKKEKQQDQDSNKEQQKGNQDKNTEQNKKNPQSGQAEQGPRHKNGPEESNTGQGAAGRDNAGPGKEKKQESNKQAGENSLQQQKQQDKKKAGSGQAVPQKESAKQNDATTSAAQKSDRQQRARGRMSKEEAARLLEAMRAGEGQPVFVPAPTTDSSRTPTGNW